MPEGNTKKIKILILAANPQDTTRLQLYEEAHGIDEALRKTDFRDYIELFPKWAVRVDDIGCVC